MKRIQKKSQAIKVYQPITNKYDQKDKKCRYELANEPKYQSNRRFLRSNLAL